MAKAVSLTLILSALAASAGDSIIDSDFEKAAVGRLPDGWQAGKTGEGPGSVWKVVSDATAPRGPKALAQTSSEGPRPLFNLCVDCDKQLADLDLTVSFKAVAGKIDQGGGPVWRYQDANNYYVCRMNPLESNFRVYKVVGGKRTQLGTADAELDEGQWEKIRIVHRGDQIQCYLGGKLLLSAKDGAIAKPGCVGLWTKADAVTHFDGLSVTKP